nr:hypothetical protein [uncultured Undibacterium sp.]
MKIPVEFKFVSAVALAGAAWWVTTLPEHYRKEGRMEERSKAKSVSDAAVKDRDNEFKQIASDLKSERENHAKTKNELDAKFNQYVADVRAGRVAGLRIARSGLCPAGAEETTRTSGNEEEATVRLPGTLEENLLRFAHDRDQVIKDFEDFKQEVRLVKCFAD